MKTKKVQTGLDILTASHSSAQQYPGHIVYLCHGASVNAHLEHGLPLLKQVFGNRFKAVFSPQHGLFAEEQDNMIESGHSIHPHFKLPIYSLYSETRSPTEAMLDGIDHLFIDLQDVGCRAYTYVYSMLLTMEACGKKGIEVIILDRPNPLNGIIIEGNILENIFSSYIGLYPLPMRHGMTLGEIAQMAVLNWGIDCELSIIKMEGWDRSLYFDQTGLPWVLPSPNMPSLSTNLVYPGLVLLEGTNLSEGRGTTRPFEIFGHPEIHPYALIDELNKAFSSEGLNGFVLRPLYFKPTFDKYMDKLCGGFQIHVTNLATFRPWQVGQVMLRELYRILGADFNWRPPPFEYDYERLPVDLLNGTDQLRMWVEEQGGMERLVMIEMLERGRFMDMRKGCLLY